MRRRAGEEYNPECIAPTVKFGGGSIMIWGCMSARGVGEATVCEGRMNSSSYIETLEGHLEASIVKLFDEDDPEYIFQQDNAPCHRSKASVQWFCDNKIPLLDWPPQSPDLSPIENLWKILKNKVGLHKPSSKKDLERIIFEEWEKISEDVCSTLVATMPKRIRSVIKAKGGHTKY